MALFRSLVLLLWNQGVKLSISGVIFNLITVAAWQMELAALVNGRCFGLSSSTFRPSKSKDPTETNVLISVVFAMLICGNAFSWHIKGKRRFIALSTRNGKQKDNILNLLLLPEVMQAVVVLGES